MTHRERYAEACRKAFENFHIPDSFWEKRLHQRGGHTKQWTKEEAEQLIEYCRRGLYSVEISQLMGRSTKAIQKAFVRFGFPRLHNICPPCGSDNPAWRGGIHIANGYRFLKKPDHPYANSHGYVQEHRLIVEEHLGRYLLPSEVVHHKDGNHSNNDIENLEVFSSNGEHLRATLAGVPHNVSHEGRKRISENTRAAWMNSDTAARMKSKPESFGSHLKELWKDPSFRKMMMERRKKNKITPCHEA